jgi:hypothetical protein
MTGELTRVLAVSRSYSLHRHKTIVNGLSSDCMYISMQDILANAYLLLSNADL